MLQLKPTMPTGSVARKIIHIHGRLQGQGPPSEDNDPRHVRTPFLTARLQCWRPKTGPFARRAPESVGAAPAPRIAESVFHQHHCASQLLPIVCGMVAGADTARKATTLDPVSSLQARGQKHSLGRWSGAKEGVVYSGHFHHAQHLINLKDFTMYAQRPISTSFKRVLFSLALVTCSSAVWAAPWDKPTPTPVRDGSVTKEIDSRVFVGTRDSRGTNWCSNAKNDEDRNEDSMRDAVESEIGSGRYWNFRYTLTCKYSQKDKHKTRVQLMGTAKYSY